MKNHFTRILATLLTLVMLMSVLAVLPFEVAAYDKNDKPDGTNPPVGSPVPEGITVYDGTPSTTLTQDTDGAYLITSAADFMYFRDTVAATAATTDVFRLTADIALNDASYGSSGSHNNLAYILDSATLTFAGTLDGAGHTIYNMYGYTGHWDRLSVTLFKEVTGTVKNLNFDGVRLIGTWSGSNQQKASVISAHLKGTVDNVHIKNALIENKNGGALAGIASFARDGAVVSNSSFSGTILSPSGSVGGIFGLYEDITKSAPITVTNCTVNADLQGISVGGILGALKKDNSPQYGYIITDCTHSGDIVATEYAGGIVGRIHYPDKIAELTGCTNYGSVKTTSTNAADVFGAGGIAGALATYVSTATPITDCVNYASVESPTYAGGIVGCEKLRSTPLCLTNCANYGSVTSPTGVAGGMVGKAMTHNGQYAYGQLQVLNSANYGKISADIAGGIIGRFTATQNNRSTIVATGYVSDSSIIGVTKASAVAGEFNYEYQNAASTKDFVLEHVWLKGNVSVAEGGTIAVFAASSATTKTAVAGTPGASAVSCGFELTFHIGDAVTTPVTLYHTDGTAYTGYYDGSTECTSPYPAYTGDSFTADAQTALNTLAKDNGGVLWAQGMNAPVLVNTISFSGATMTLGGNMALNIKLHANAFANLDVSQVSFINAETGEGVAVAAGSDYYTLSYNSIRAAELAKEMKLYIQVKLGDDFINSTNILTYSPAIYLANLYTNYNADGNKADEANAAKVVNVVKAMLVYGAVAEAKDRAITPEETAVAALAVAKEIALPTDFTATGYTTEGVLTQADKDIINAYAPGGVGAALTGGIQLSLNGMTEGTTVRVQVRDDFKTYTAGVDGRIIIDMIYANMITDIITLTFNDTDTATLTVGNFLESRNSGDEAILAQATIMYMMAVKDYMSEKDSLNRYTVTFRDMNGERISYISVYEGEGAAAPAAPVVDGYRFTGWDKSFDHVTANITVTAQYVKTYTITYLNRDGSVYMTHTVDENTVPAMPEGPEDADYVFVKWNPETLGAITQDVTVSPIFREPVLTDYKIMQWTIGGNAIWLGNVKTNIQNAVAEANPDIFIVDGMDISNYRDTKYFDLPGYTLWAYGGSGDSDNAETGELGLRYFGSSVGVFYKTELFTQAGEIVSKKLDYRTTGYTIFPLQNTDGVLIPIVTAFYGTTNSGKGNIDNLLNGLKEELGTSYETAVIRLRTETAKDSNTDLQPTFTTEADENGYHYTSGAGIDIKKEGTHVSATDKDHAYYMIIYGNDTRDVSISPCELLFSTADSSTHQLANKTNPAWYCIAVTCTLTISDHITSRP